MVDLQESPRTYSAENGHDAEPHTRLPYRAQGMLCRTSGCSGTGQRQARGGWFCDKCYEEIVYVRAWRIKQIRKRRERVPARIAFSVAAIFGCIDAGLSASVPWAVLWLIMAVQFFAAWGLIGLLKPLWEDQDK